MHITIPLLNTYKETKILMVKTKILLPHKEWMKASKNKTTKKNKMQQQHLCIFVHMYACAVGAFGW